MAQQTNRRRFIHQAGSLTLLSPFLTLAACDATESPGQLSEISGGTMGTRYSVKITDLPAHIDLRRLKEEAEAVLESVNAQMSTYRSDSELSRLNDAAADAWVEASADTLSVVSEALATSTLTNGAFDPTLGRLSSLWGFGAGGGGYQVPTTKQTDDFRPSLGYRALQADKTGLALRKLDTAVQLDLSGIAKGFGVDKLASHLESVGIGHYLIDIGGELRGRGWNHNGGAWRIGIERPGYIPGTLQRIVRLNGQALATSGNYRIYFEKDGRRYSHILNPTDGRTVRNSLASVTVLADTAMRADALSTALMVMGLENGMALARREKIAAFFIAVDPASDGLILRETASPAFIPHLVS